MTEYIGEHIPNDVAVLLGSDDKRNPPKRKWYPNMLTHPYPIIPPHPHHNMPPHIYSSIPSHPIYVCPYFTSTPMYVPYVVPHYSHIPPLGYLHTSSSRISSYVLPPQSSKNIIKYRRNIRDKISN